MPYILNTPEQTRQMLKEIGLSSLDDLFSHLPSPIKIKDGLCLPDGLSELEVSQKIKNLAKKNKPLARFNSFLGAGLYSHYIPAALKHLLNRCEFYTAYTPYQAECSQGILQAIYEYQSYICLLTGMEVTNASLYDGAASLAEAILMSLRINKRKKILLASSIHPEYREVVRTYLKGFDFTIEEVPFSLEGFLDLNVLREKIDENVSCLAFQSPNFFGLIEDIEKITALVKAKDVMVILVTNPFTLSILAEPVKLGVDIVCGDGQPLGGYISFGGPSFGFLATRKDYLRQLPGRIVGRTKDSEGKTGFCLTLQAREQHIRREKATSNICSNQSLNAIGAGIYLSLLGKTGFEKVGLYSLNLAHYLYQRLKEVDGVCLPYSERFFNEFIWEVKDSKKVWRKLYKNNIIAGVTVEKFYPQLKNYILSCCTETKTKEEIDEFVDTLKRVIA